MQFNRHGNLLAVGTSTGRVIIWDFDTRVIATTFDPPEDPQHTPATTTSAANGNASPSAAAAAASTSAAKRKSVDTIVSLAFAALGNGSAVMVAHQSGVLRVYDTLTAHLVSEVIFDVRLHHIAAHPKIANVVVVVPVNHLPLLTHLCRGRYICHTADFMNVTDPNILIAAHALDPQLPHALAEPGDAPKTGFFNQQLARLPPPAPKINISLVCAADEFARGDGGTQSTELINANATSKRRVATFSVAFTRKRKRLLRGGPTGVLRTFTFELHQPNRLVMAQCIATASVQGRAPIRNIVVSRKEMVLINSYDRCMRLYPLRDIEAPDANACSLSSPLTWAPPP